MAENSVRKKHCKPRRSRQSAPSSRIMDGLPTFKTTLSDLDSDCIVIAATSLTETR